MEGYCHMPMLKPLWLVVGRGRLTLPYRSVRPAHCPRRELAYIQWQNRIIFKIIVDLGVRHDTRCEKYSNFGKRSNTNGETAEESVGL